MVDIGNDGRFSEQRDERALDFITVERRIIIDLRAQICVARPNPTVALDSVEIEFPTAQRKGVTRNFDDLFRLLVVRAIGKHNGFYIVLLPYRQLIRGGGYDT